MRLMEVNPVPLDQMSIFRDGSSRVLHTPEGAAPASSGYTSLSRQQRRISNELLFQKPKSSKSPSVTHASPNASGTAGPGASSLHPQVAQGWTQEQIQAYEQQVYDHDQRYHMRGHSEGIPPTANVSPNLPNVPNPTSHSTYSLGRAAGGRYTPSPSGSSGHNASQHPSVPPIPESPHSHAAGGGSPKSTKSGTSAGTGASPLPGQRQPTLKRALSIDKIKKATLERKKSQENHQRGKKGATRRAPSPGAPGGGVQDESGFDSYHDANTLLRPDGSFNRSQHSDTGAAGPEMQPPVPGVTGAHLSPSMTVNALTSPQYRNIVTSSAAQTFPEPAFDDPDAIDIPEIPAHVSEAANHLQFISRAYRSSYMDPEEAGAGALDRLQRLVNSEQTYRLSVMLSKAPQTVAEQYTGDTPPLEANKGRGQSPITPPYMKNVSMGKVKKGMASEVAGQIKSDHHMSMRAEVMQHSPQDPIIAIQNQARALIIGNAAAAGPRPEPSNGVSRRWLERVQENSKITLNWMANVLGLAPFPHDAMFIDVVANGDLLCRLAHAMAPSAPECPFLTEGDAFMVHKVIYFLECCRAVGVTEERTFSIVDLLGKVNPGKVLETLQDFATRCRIHGWKGEGLMLDTTHEGESSESEEERVERRDGEWATPPQQPARDVTKDIPEHAGHRLGRPADMRAGVNPHGKARAHEDGRYHEEAHAYAVHSTPIQEYRDPTSNLHHQQRLHNPGGATMQGQRHQRQDPHEPMHHIIADFEAAIDDMVSNEQELVTALSNIVGFRASLRAQRSLSRGSTSDSARLSTPQLSDDILSKIFMNIEELYGCRYKLLRELRSYRRKISGGKQDGFSTATQGRHMRNGANRRMSAELGSDHLGGVVNKHIDSFKQVYKQYFTQLPMHEVLVARADDARSSADVEMRELLSEFEFGNSGSEQLNLSSFRRAFMRPVERLSQQRLELTNAIPVLRRMVANVDAVGITDESMLAIGSKQELQLLEEGLENLNTFIGNLTMEYKDAKEQLIWPPAKEEQPSREPDRSKTASPAITVDTNVQRGQALDQLRKDNMTTPATAGPVSSDKFSPQEYDSLGQAKYSAVPPSAYGTIPRSAKPWDALSPSGQTQVPPAEPEPLPTILEGPESYELDLPFPELARCLTGMTDLSALESNGQHRFLCQGSVWEAVNHKEVRVRTLLLFHDALVIASQHEFGEYEVRHILDAKRMRLKETVPRRPKFMRLRSKVAQAVNYFNAGQHENAWTSLVAHKIIDRTPSNVASFLHKTPGLSKVEIGRYLAKKDNRPILNAYFRWFGSVFRGLRLDEAMRLAFRNVALPDSLVVFGWSKHAFPTHDKVLGWDAVELFLRDFLEWYGRWNVSASTGESSQIAVLNSLARRIVELDADFHGPLAHRSMQGETFVQQCKQQVANILAEHQSGPNAPSVHPVLPDAELWDVYGEVTNQAIMLRPSTVLSHPQSEAVDSTAVPMTIYLNEPESVAVDLNYDLKASGQRIPEGRIQVRIYGQDMSVSPSRATPQLSRTTDDHLLGKPSFTLTGTALGRKKVFIMCSFTDSSAFSTAPITVTVEPAFLKHSFEIAYSTTPNSQRPPAQALSRTTKSPDPSMSFSFVVANEEQKERWEEFIVSAVHPAGEEDAS